VNRLTRFMSVIGLSIAAVAAYAVPASASLGPLFPSGGGHAVFVQNDSVSGNQIIAYDRAADGTLKQAGSYATGGVGGVLTGSVVDHLASQGSLSYDRRHGLLYAVNAGSDTISVFRVRGDRLLLRQVLPSGGSFPVSIAVHGDTVYVLNARDGGSVQGYRVFFDTVFPLPRSTRLLGLDPTAAPEFVNTPGQVAFTPDGSQLVVTTKANGSSIDVFSVRHDGRLSAAPVVNPLTGAVPFAVDFDAAGHLVVTEAGTNAVATFSLAGNGTITSIDTKLTGQAATCWIVQANGVFYASNAGSATLSGFGSSLSGVLTPLGLTPTDGGTVDAAATPDGRYLYVQAGAAGIVDEYRVEANGSLTPIGSVTVPDAVGGEGIAVA
jgi:6-phosphogluconolactonase (cycloisomerase 2 family)